MSATFTLVGRIEVPMFLKATRDRVTHTRQDLVKSETDNTRDMERMFCSISNASNTLSVCRVV